MCELFQKKFLESVFNRIKDDTFAIDILKEKLGLDIVECPYKLVGCKSYYVQMVDKKALTRKGFFCPECEIKMCESCKKFKTIKDKCIECVIKEKSDTGMFELSCPNCENNLNVVKWTIGYFCTNCKIHMLKINMDKPSCKFSIMSDGLGPEFHKEIPKEMSEDLSESE